MSFYKKHLFFCINQRENGKACCNNASATEMCKHAKAKIKELNIGGPGGIRVSSSGCLGRCALGPSLVVYPEGVWYSYCSKNDIDEILEKHIMGGNIVERLLMRKKC
jgi:(2Fe-2S) ferredoxin